jgi:hypothetical protein
MSTAVELREFQRALFADPTHSCRDCGGNARDDDCELGSHYWLHPADAWTIRELRALSINGSFR